MSWRRRCRELSWEGFIEVLERADLGDGSGLDRALKRVREDGLGEELIDLDVAVLGALRADPPGPDDPDPTPESQAAFARRHAPELMKHIRLDERLSVSDLEPILLVIAAAGPAPVATIPPERQQELFTLAAAAELRRVVDEQGSSFRRFAGFLLQAFGDLIGKAPPGAA